MVLTSLAALALVGVVASTLLVVRGRAAGSRFPWPTTLSKVFGSTTVPAKSAAVTPLSPAAPLALPVYYSQTSGDPTVLANWNSVRAGGGSNPANFTTAGQTFAIQNGNNMTANAVWTVSGSGTILQIETGGTLTANAAVTIGATATFQIDGGGTYVHNNTMAFGSTILNGTESFASTSTFVINNSSTTGPSGTAFGNLTINYTSDPGGVVSAGGGITTINGTLSVVNTSTREFRLAASSPASLTTTIGGDLLISGGTLNLVTGTTTLTLNVGGNLNQSGGTLTSTGPGIDTITYTGTGKTFTQSVGTLTNTNINWLVNSGASITLANNLPIASSRTATVNGTLNCGANLVTGAGGFTLSSGGTLGIGDPNGITASDTTSTGGNIRVSGARSFSTGANYTYSGSTPQVTGNGLPSTINGLTVSNTAGVTLSGNTTANGASSIGSGCTLNTSTLTLAVGSTFVNSGTVNVNGAFQIDNGGSASENNFVYGGNSTLVFNISGFTVSGTPAFWPTTNGPPNVTVKNGVQMGVARAISGVFQYGGGQLGGANNLTLNGVSQVNVGGFVSGSPTYGSLSLLKYNTGGSYGRNGEWLPNVTSGPGYPANVQLSNNTTLDLPNGSTAQPFQAGGSLQIDSGSQMLLAGGSPMTAPLNVLGDVVNDGTLTLSTLAGGDLNLGGSMLNSGAYQHNGRTLTFNGAQAATWSGASGGTDFGAVVVNKIGNGVSLTSALSVQTLTLTSRNVTTTSTNLLTVLNTAPGAISGSSSSYISGPLARVLPASLASGSTYAFPLGKGGFNPFELVNPMTTSGGTVTIQAEEFDGNSGGTAGTGLKSLNTNRYWQGIITANSGNFTNTTVRLSDASVTLTSRIGKSETVPPGGTYNSIGGTVAGSTIVSEAITSFSFFNIGTITTETDVAVSAGDLLITDSNGGTSADTLTLSLNGANVRVTDPNNVLNAGAGATQIDIHTVEVSFVSISSIHVNTLGGNDTLTLDLSGGDIIPDGGLTFNGGDPTSSPGDKLSIIGGSQGTVTYNYSSAHDGNILMQNFGTVTYTGLEPITNSGTATDVVFNLPIGGTNDVTLGDDGVAANGMSRLSGATIETTDFANPSGSLKINRGNATDTLVVNALPDFTASLTIGSAGSEFSTITFAGAMTLAADKNLAGNATGTINCSTAGSDLATVGAGTIALTTARDIVFASGSSLSVVDGALTLNANQQASPTAGNFGGLDVSGATIQSTGTGNIVMNGRGGMGTNTGLYGVRVLSSGQIKATTTGSVTITGVGGGTGASDSDYGVSIGSSGQIQVNNGPLNITGTSGPVGAFGHGVILGFSGDAGVLSTGSGGITIDAIGNGTNVDFYASANTGNTHTIGGASATGPITFVANNVSLDAGPGTVNIQTTGAVSFRQRTNGTPINLGGADVFGGSPSLGLSNAEIDTVSAPTLNIGDINSGPITVSADISRTVATILNLVSGANIDLTTGSLNSDGGNVSLNPGTNVFPSHAGVDVATGTATLSLTSAKDLKIVINNTTLDSGCTQLNVAGLVELNGASLMLSGAYTPVAGDSFTIVNNDAGDAITGTFNGLAEGAVIPNFLGSSLGAKITYTGGDGNDVVLTVVAPQIAVEQPSGNALPYGAASVDFGNQTIGTTSPAKTFTIKNVGAANLSVGPITKFGTNAADFTVDTSATSATVAPGDSTTFTITFTPGAPGPRNAGIHIANSDAGKNPFDIALTGTGAFVVTKTDDTNDGTCDADCSLREAVAAANANPDTNTISFAIPLSDSGCNSGFGPCTITLGGTELAITESVNIDNSSSGESVIVDANHLSRVFNVSSGKAVSIKDLTVSGGSKDLGGGILNNGALTITGSTISDNMATSHGGGIYSNGALVATNSTVTGNTANANGGGIYVAGGTMKLTNVTVAGNSADNDDSGSETGGGIFSSAGTSSLRNTIVAYNFDGSGSFVPPILDDVSGSFTSLGHNFVSAGDNGSGFTNGVSGDQVGTAAAPLDPRLDFPGNNGGPTATLALLGGSPAIDAGDVCVLTGCGGNSPTVTRDQRGVARPQGNNVDIGAFELEAFVVNTTADPGDGVCTTDPGGCTLREAIEAANLASGPRMIAFSIPFDVPGHYYYANDNLPGVSDVQPTAAATDDASLSNPDPDYPNSWWSIHPATPLPQISNAVFINGYSQPGASANTKHFNEDDIAILRLELKGTGLDTGLDLEPGAGGSTISGLVINNFAQTGVFINDTGWDEISGNFIGTDVSGTLAQGSTANGICLANGDSNLIGGDLPSARNLISGHASTKGTGLDIRTEANVVEGNYIGTDRHGLAPLGNKIGVSIRGGVEDNTIGCEVLDGSNLISGNSKSGVSIDCSDWNNVVGNFIGTDRSGAAPIANGIGVNVFDSSYTLISFLGPGAGNVISGNSGDGVLIKSSNPGYTGGGNTVQGNFIGTDKDGMAALGNGGAGVELDGSSDNEIGCEILEEANVISSNTGDGVEITGGASGNLVQGNFIGVAADGMTALGNSGSGVEIYTLPTESPGASNNIIGVETVRFDLRNRFAGRMSKAMSSAKKAGGNRLAGSTIEASANRDAVKTRRGRVAKTVLSNRQAVRVRRANLAAKTSTRASFKAAPANKQLAGNRLDKLAGVTGVTPTPSLTPPTGLNLGGNIIANNGVDGVKISNPLDLNNLITENSIYANTGLGINLVGGVETDEVTPNDPDDQFDGDSGPNNLQNFPLITDAAADTQTIKGVLHSSVDDFEIDFYLNDDCDLPSGHGEGKIYLGTTEASAGGNGEAPFTFNSPLLPFTAGQFITATARDFNGNTSEFSACFQATISAPAPEIAVEQPSGSDLSDGSATVDFGQQNVGTTSAAKTFYIKNVGAADLTLGAITKDGTNSTDFTVDTTGMSGTVTPGNSTTFTVTFTPGTAGLRNAAIHIANNDSNENPFDIALAGTTCPPTTLGNYPDKSVVLSTDAVVTPSPLPTNAARLNVATSTNFKGKLEGSPSTGVVRITDAHPAGTYIVTVTAFDTCGATTTRTFTLTVTTQETCNPVNFAAAKNFGTGTQPVSVAIGDFNGDGKQDLAVANSNAGSDGVGQVAILLGDGAGGFSAPAVFNVGTTPLSVAVGDFNGDGNEDLAVANANSNNVSVLLGNGGGGFGAATNFAVGLAPIALAVGDFDGDGKPDLATANRDSDNVSVLLGNGAGSFGTATNFTVGSKPQSIAVGDFNNDGKQDMVVGNSNSNNVSVLVGNGAGGFGAATNFDVGTMPLSVAIGDFTGDGYQDLSAGNYDSNNVSVLVNDGSGGFGTATNFPAGSKPLSIAAGDFNGDGRQDLAVADQGANSVSILAGNGSGVFGSGTNFSVGNSPRSVAVGDFNGDGRQDLAVANQLSDNVSVLLRQCAPTAADSNVSGQILDSNGKPLEGAAVRMSGTQNRLAVTDANGNYHFDNVETNGFYTVVPARANYSFSPAQRSFSALGQRTDAVFSASAAGTALNPLDTTEYFVRQQYVDFLGREPDEAGLNFWVNNIESCGTDANCRSAKRIDTSAAFFLSIEFQQTGYLVFKTYQAAYGDLSGAPVPIKLAEFKPDTAEIGNVVVVNQPDWQTVLDHNKQAYLAEFVQRPRFTTAYAATLTPGEFVDKLFLNAGVTTADADRALAIAEFGSAATSSDAGARARALRRVADNAVLSQQEFNQAFVLMQYFGYLRRDANAGRDADFSGYNFWLDKLNAFNGNFRDAEMVKAFLVSGEYRGRFPR
jgi:CSLREA domain-containing protein